MKKKLISAAVLSAAMTMCTLCASAADYAYAVGKPSVSTESISVSVKNESDSASEATIYIAMYDEYNTLLGVKSQKLELEVGESTTITKPFSANAGVSAKAFVWKNMLTPFSKYSYKTTENNEKIEFGGDI